MSTTAAPQRPPAAGPVTAEAAAAPAVNLARATRTVGVEPLAGPPPTETTPDLGSASAPVAAPPAWTGPSSAGAVSETQPSAAAARQQPAAPGPPPASRWEAPAPGPAATPQEESGTGSADPYPGTATPPSAGTDATTPSPSRAVALEPARPAAAVTTVVPATSSGDLPTVGTRVPWPAGETGQASTSSFRASDDHDGRVSRGALGAPAAVLAPELPTEPSPVSLLRLPAPVPAPVPPAPTGGSASGTSACHSGSYHQTGLDLAVLGPAIAMLLPQDPSGCSVVVDDRVLRRADDPGASPD